MKLTAVKKISAAFLVLVFVALFTIGVSAETVQDRLEGQLNEIIDQYQSADPESQESIQERFNQFLEANGLEDMDLSDLTDTDIAHIIGDLGNSFSLMEDFAGLAGDAWSSAFAMLQDVVSGGDGTADGSNTATPGSGGGSSVNNNSNNSNDSNNNDNGGNNNPNGYNSPNVIVPAVPTTAPNTQQAPAVGIPPTTVIPPISTEPDVETTTAPAMVGVGVVGQEDLSHVENVVIEDSSATSPSSIIVLVVLSIATLAVVASMVVFFIVKRK